MTITKPDAVISPGGSIKYSLLFIIINCETHSSFHLFKNCGVSQLNLSLTFPDSMDMRRGRAAESEGETVWVVGDLHNPGREKTSKTSAHYMHVCVWIRVVCVALLLGLGGDQQPQGAPYAEGLADHGFHFGERPEEQQVLIDGVDLPADLQTGHLDGQTGETLLFVGC